MDTRDGPGISFYNSTVSSVLTSFMVPLLPGASSSGSSNSFRRMRIEPMNFFGADPEPGRRVEIGAGAGWSAEGQVSVFESQANQSLIAQILRDPDAGRRVVWLSSGREGNVFGSDAQRDFTLRTDERQLFRV